MKAALIDRYGSPDVFHIAEIEQPKPSDDQVLVMVRAASLNPFDSKVREGRMQQWLPLTFPAVLGGDFAGTVAATGKGVEGFSIGERVFGQATLGHGSFAEFAPVKADRIAAMPADIGFTEAAALPLTGVSALQALVTHMGLRAGQRILIHGGAGGIGTMAIQLAKHLGAWVAATASGKCLEYVRLLGADVAIDYRQQAFEDAVRDLDAVYDTVGGDTFERSFRVLKKGGVMVTMVADADTPLAAEYGVRSISQQTKVTAAALDELRGLVESGEVAAHVGREFPFERIADAFRAFEAGNIEGKTVLVMRP